MGRRTVPVEVRQVHELHECPWCGRRRHFRRYVDGSVFAMTRRMQRAMDFYRSRHVVACWEENGNRLYPRKDQADAE